MTTKELNNMLEKFKAIITTDKIEESEITHYPTINFYGCSFNFANEGCAEARLYGGDDIYNPRKEA